MSPSDTTLYILPADPKCYPFKRSPLAKVDGVTLLRIAMTEYREAGVETDDMLCAGADEEVLLTARRLGIPTLATEDSRLEFFGLLERDAFQHYDTFVVCSLQFPFLDKSAVVDTVARHTLSGRLLIVQESAFPQVIPVGVWERIAEVSCRETPSMLHPYGQTVVTLKTPWSVRSLKDLRALELLRARKRIVFHTEAYTAIGMGHLYRSVAIASHLQNFDVRFICSTRSPAVAAMGSSWNIPVAVVDEPVTAAAILKLEPDLVVNDVLDTGETFMRELVSRCKVVNFEDVGDGAPLAHATINDLYEHPVVEMSNGYWGHDYYFLREEFESAVPRPVPAAVRSLLVTFGGTDPNDLTRKVLRTIHPLCRDRNITIHLVTGSGYGRLATLEEELMQLASPLIDHIHRTGIMSSIMERSDIAICSNGRTTYELSHMHLPSIVICHHEREATHAFAREENGFVNLGVFNGTTTLDAVAGAFEKLVDDTAYRTALYNQMKGLDFKQNKQRVLNIIAQLMEET